MEWATVRNCGKICESYKQLQINEGKIKTGQFLYETLREFAKASTKIYDTTGDIAFTYKEKQLSSIFLPAFYNLSYGAMQEVPTRRRNREQDSFVHGWLDYWVQKDDSWVYLIEMKHAWQFLNGKFRKDSAEKIDKSISQLKNIPKSEIRELSITETTYKISLLILPIWRNLSIDIQIDEEEEYPTPPFELEKTATDILDQIESKISWMGLWSTPDRMQYTFKPSHSTRLQTFPGVILVAALVK